MGSLYKRTFKTPDGTIHERPTWWLKYYQNGRAIRESSGTTKERVARRMLRVREGDVEHGIPVHPQLGRMTFEEGTEDVLNDYRVNGRKTLSETEYRLKHHLGPVFGGRRIANITTADVRAFVAQRQAVGASNGEINRELSALKRMFSLAVQAVKLHHKPYIPMLRETNVRTGFFEREQFLAVVAHLKPDLRPVIEFAYITGWRIPSEVLTLERRQVDFTGETITLDPGTTKNDAGRVFPFTRELKALLERQKEHTEVVARRRGVIIPHVFHRDDIRSPCGTTAVAAFTIRATCGTTPSATSASRSRHVGDNAALSVPVVSRSRNSGDVWQAAARDVGVPPWPPSRRRDDIVNRRPSAANRTTGGTLEKSAYPP